MASEILRLERVCKAYNVGLPTETEVLHDIDLKLDHGEFLALMGVQARLARNGIEALSACADTAPDLVLMDIQMPGMDGLECARRLRAQQREGKLPSFPILALTAHALDADVAASLEAGMDEHLTKPLDFVALRTRLQRWLKLPEPN